MYHNSILYDIQIYITKLKALFKILKESAIKFKWKNVQTPFKTNNKRTLKQEKAKKSTEKHVHWSTTAPNSAVLYLAQFKNYFALVSRKGQTCRLSINSYRLSPVRRLDPKKWCDNRRRSCGLICCPHRPCCCYLAHLRPTRTSFPPFQCLIWSCFSGFRFSPSTNTSVGPRLINLTRILNFKRSNIFFFNLKNKIKKTPVFFLILWSQHLKYFKL